MFNTNGNRCITTAALAAALALGAVGCSNLPGTSGQQGAAIGGLGGAAAGAAIGGKEHRLIGALLGGALGAGGGYLIGANSDKITGHDQSSAQEAVRKAQATPATPQQAREAVNADVNRDGFVTMDEVVAMKQAGFTNQEMLDRMRVTGQIFELTTEQQNYLRTNGIDQSVIDEIPNLNRDVRDRVLSTPPPTGRSPYPPPPVHTTPSQTTIPSQTSPVPPPPGP